MATKIDKSTLSTGKNLDAVQTMNLIRNNASPNYQSVVPVATRTKASLQAIGQVFMTYPDILNEYLTALWNKVGAVRMRYREYTNPLSAAFRKGELGLGEFVEEIFVGLCQAHQFDPESAVNTVFQREIPDVKAAYHKLSIQVYYKQTIQENELEMAFTSWDNVDRLTELIVARMYNAGEYDEYQAILQLIAQNIISGDIKVEDVTELAGTPSALTKAILIASDELTLMSRNYNYAGGHTHTPKEDQFLLGSSTFWASQNVDVYAVSFNMDKVEFMGHRILINRLGDIDTERLNAMFGGQPGYEEIGESDLENLNKIDAVLLDREWVQLYTKLRRTVTDPYNGDGLYFSYKYHMWDVLASSPFSNAVAFSRAGAPTVTKVSVTPSAVTMPKGVATSFIIKANVTTTGFAPASVSWEVTSGVAGTDVEIIPQGDNTCVVNLLPTATSAEVIITATSTFNSARSATCAITLEG